MIGELAKIKRKEKSLPMSTPLRSSGASSTAVLPTYGSLSTKVIGSRHLADEEADAIEDEEERLLQRSLRFQKRGSLSKLRGKEPLKRQDSQLLPSVFRSMSSEAFPSI